MFGHHKESKKDTEAAELLAAVRAGKLVSPPAFGAPGSPSGVSFGAEDDPNAPSGFPLGGTNIQVMGNANPEQIQAALARAQEVLGQMMANGGQLPAGMAHLANPDTVSQLERLATLHAQGALTDEEFQAQKRHLLSGQ
jgi:hypothetical protein